MATSAERSRAAAALYAAGGLLGALGLALPGWEGRQRGQLWLLCGVALVSAGVLALRRELTPVQAHLTVLSGTASVAVAQYLNGGGAATATTGVLYLLMSVYSFGMFNAWAASLHLLVLAAAQAAVLVQLGESAQAPAQVVLTIGTAGSAGALVGWLVGQVRRLAASDPLTGLPNRRTADAALDRAVAAAQRSGAPLCVAVLDLDAFKQLNDTRGHASGDRVLQDAARQWTGELRRNDLLARIGGDEFLVVLEACDMETAREIGRRLADATPPQVRCSIGLALWDGSEVSAELLDRADRALYEAKRRGSGGVAVTPSRRS